jgi:hypothetical protein
LFRVDPNRTERGFAPTAAAAAAAAAVEAAPAADPAAPAQKEEAVWG